MGRKGRTDLDGSEDAPPWWRRPGRGAFLSLLSLAGLSLIAASGLERLKARVDSLPDYRREPRIQLMDVPAWVDRERWRPQIMNTIDLPAEADLLKDQLARDVGEQLKASGWVSEVRQVAQDLDGAVRVWCSYRRPIAMVRTRDESAGEFLYVAVDKEGVRLPQKYRDVENAGWIQIYGVADRDGGTPVPEVGQSFRSDDAVAAILIANVLFIQDFSPRIVAVDVSNFKGRQDRRNDRIVVLARNAENRVFRFPWGSAIGEEIEETSWVEKVRLISAQIKKGGSHVQAADVSIFPDRIIERVQPAISTADGSLHRGR